MRIKNLDVSNFQSYDEANINFGDGVTLIHGENGAGKSSILRAIFGALYQTKATNETSADYDLADFVHNDEDEAEVLLKFVSGGNEYTIEWVIGITEDEDGERKGSTKSCTLTSPALPEPEEGVTAVRERVTALLGMGPTEFANSVYVQQKRFTRLLNATDSERRTMLDGLLGLNSVDEYVDRMKLARRPAKRKRDAAKNRRKEVQSRIDSVDEEALKQQKKKLSSEISRLEERQDTLQDEVREWQRRSDRIGDDIEKHKENVERKETIESKIEEKKSTVGSLNRECKQWDGEIDDLEAKIETLEAEIEDISNKVDRPLNDAEDAAEFVSQKQKQKESAFQTLEQKRNEVTRLEDKINDVESERLSPLKENLSTLKSRLQTVKEELSASTDKLEEERKNRDEAVCSYLDVESPPEEAREAVLERKEAADERREELGQELTRVDAEREQAEEALPDLRNQLTDAEQTLEALEDTVGGADDASAQFEEALQEAESHASELNITIDRGAVLETLGTDLPDAHESSLSSYYELAKAAIDDASISDELDREHQRLAVVPELTRSLARAAQYQQLVDVAERVDGLESEIDEHETTLDEAEEEKSNLRSQQTEKEEMVQAGELVLEHFEDVEEQEEEVAEKQEEVRDISSEIDEVTEEVSTVEAELEGLREQHSSAIEEFEAAKQAHEDAEDSLALAEEASNAFDAIDDKKSGIKTRREKMDAHSDRIASLSSEISELREEKQSIKQELGDGPSLQEKKSKKKMAEENVRSLENDEEDVSDELKEKNASLNSVKKDLETLREDQSRKQELDQKVEEANDLIDDLTTIIETYESVKVELREETLGLLNTYTNEVFDELYQNESYRGIRIDPDYNVDLVRSDGTLFDPNKGSGGEGVIVNIALRAGVYRTIAEREDTNGSSLPPFILDEPTNHLDNEHVDKLEDIIKSIQKWDVPQVFIVTHRDSMMTQADHELFVEKDDTTDRSTATLTST